MPCGQTERRSSSREDSWIGFVLPFQNSNTVFHKKICSRLFLHFATFFTSIERSAHRPQTRSSSDALLRSFCLWLMGVPPIPKCQYSLSQINLLQTVFAFCYCAELVILYDRAGREGSQGKTLDLRWQKNFGFVWEMFGG